MRGAIVGPIQAQEGQLVPEAVSVESGPENILGRNTI